MQGSWPVYALKVFCQSLSCACSHAEYMFAGTVVAVTSALHKPPSLQLTKSGDKPQWMPLTMEGSWPYDKAVQQALPEIQHQVLEVSLLLRSAATFALLPSADLAIEFHRHVMVYTLSKPLPAHKNALECDFTVYALSI